MHTINERFGDDGLADKGRIDIEPLRTELEDDSAAVAGFIKRDNGIGLNEEILISFCTPFSKHKIEKGGKGIPYDKLLLDAQARNAIFFDKLGLGG